MGRGERRAGTWSARSCRCEYLGPAFRHPYRRVSTTSRCITPTRSRRARLTSATARPWVRWWLHGEFINLARGQDLQVDRRRRAGRGPDRSRLPSARLPVPAASGALPRARPSSAGTRWTAARTGLRRLLDRFAAARAGRRGRRSPIVLSDRRAAHLDAFDARRSATISARRGRWRPSRGGGAGTTALTDADLSALARQFDAVLGIGLAELSPADLDLAPERGAGSVAEEVEAAARRASRARASRDFARSDQLRGELAALGVAVEDHPGGTSSWRWAAQPKSASDGPGIRLRSPGRYGNSVTIPFIRVGSKA